jgi:hypothetical protein
MATRLRLTATIWIVLALVAGCGTVGSTSVPVPPTGGAATAPAGLLPGGTPALAITPTAAAEAQGLTDEEAATLSSLEQVDGYPLYTMRYRGGYDQAASAVEGAGPMAGVDRPAPSPAWACSLFAALGDAENRLYGRNFDWEFSPALLLFTDPPGGYASVSMVDIAYLGFEESESRGLVDLPLSQRRGLLAAPFLPFDGMNEQGLAVGMAAVPPGDVRPDPGKETIGSLGVIRHMLDRAAGVGEAVSILESYNVDMSGGPPVHYLLADRSGRSVLVEFYQGETVVMPNGTPWHLATNFLRASVQEAQGQCWRYDRMGQALAAAAGQLSTPEAMDLLAEVSQPGTQWSVVYGLSSGDVEVTMGRAFDRPHRFHLPSASE